MPRSVNAVASRARRKKVLKQTRGYFGARKNVWTVAKNSYEKALTYAYRDRKTKKRMFRGLWIQRINAAAKQLNFKYSLLIHGLALANVQVNRKMLADVAVTHPEDFKKYVDIAQEAIKGNLPKAVKVKAQEVEVKASKAEVIEPVEKVASKTVEPKKVTAAKKDTAPKTTTVKKTATVKTTTEKAPVKKVSAPKTAAAPKTTTKKDV